MDLKGKVVVITGGTHGLGRALAQALVAEDAHGVISARAGEELKASADDIGCRGVAADVTCEEEVAALAETVVNEFGRLDIWVNNAGLWTPHVPVEQLDIKRVHDMVEVNLFGTIYGSRAALKYMKPQGGGTIANILSTSALEGRPGSAGYGASKYAAMGFTKSLRLEVQANNIQVIAIYPGGMKTNLFDESQPADYDNYMEPSFVAEKIVNNLKQAVPQEELIIKRS